MTVRRFRWVVMGWITGAMAASSQAHAQRGVFDSLPVVGVHVVGVPEAASRLGVDSTVMRLGLEARLREAGFSIRTGGELAAVQETPRVLFDIGALTIDSAYFFSVTLELLEPVRLKRSGVEHYAVSWQRQVMGAAPLSSALEATWEAAGKLVGIFLETRRRTMALAAGGR